MIIALCIYLIIGIITAEAIQISNQKSREFNYIMCVIFTPIILCLAIPLGIIVIIIGIIAEITRNN